MALWIDQHVLGLDIEMKHLMGMSNLKRFCHRFEHGQIQSFGIHVRRGAVCSTSARVVPSTYSKIEVRHVPSCTSKSYTWNDGRSRELCCQLRASSNPRHRRSVDGTLPQKDAPALREHFSSLFQEGHAWFWQLGAVMRVSHATFTEAKPPWPRLPFQAMTSSRHDTGFPGWTVAQCFVAAHHAPADRRTTARRHPAGVGDVAGYKGAESRAGRVSQPTRRVSGVLPFGLLQALLP